MLHDKLKLNDEKTELLIIGTLQQLDKVVITHIRVGNTNIHPVPFARNLGSWFDANMSMLDHISKTCKSSFHYLYNIHRIWKYLSKQSTESLIHAFISSHLDYCNSLLYGLPNCSLIKLQHAQVACARLIFRVHTGPGNPGKSWNFIIAFSRTGKSWKSNAGPGKSWKSVKLNKVIKFSQKSKMSKCS